ncbi:MAG: hypothetical protein DRP84_11080 [Spirochaetes bacterium]|nr:MAG: hypothetical protein DRP84_11080 [Spirochaetota bacterium]
MKKKIFAIFAVAALLLVTPASGLYVKTSSFKRVGYICQPNDIREIKFTEKEIHQLEELIKLIKNPKEKREAEELLNKIILQNGVIDIATLKSVFNETNSPHINPDFLVLVYSIVLPSSVFDLIIKRLGWVYDLWLHSKIILNDARILLRDAKTIPIELKSDIAKLTFYLRDLKNIIQLWIEAKWWQLFLKLKLFIDLIEDIQSIISSIQEIISNLERASSDVIRFAKDLTNFVKWVTEEHWKDNILIDGKVLKGFIGYPDVKVSCRGYTITTDETGEYEIVFPPEEDTDVPVWWMHSCQVTAIPPNGTEKSSPLQLSYVFSGGEMYWIFIFIS